MGDQVNANYTERLKLVAKAAQRLFDRAIILERDHDRPDEPLEWIVQDDDMNQLFKALEAVNHVG